MHNAPGKLKAYSGYLEHSGHANGTSNRVYSSVDPMQIVNVASVPKRSPFRYPGGKTWLIPQIRKWLLSKRPLAAELIEPFAGGAIVGLTCAFERLTQAVTLVEKDQDVAAVWHTIFNAKQGKWLADRIATFEFSPDSVRAELDAPRAKLSLRERAFKTMLKNRVQRGGILAPGAGLMKVGENGRGMASRWYPQTLSKRILEIADIKVRSRIGFVEGDGIEVMRQNAGRTDTVFFIDPPYTVAGRRLYTFSDIDHEELFRVASEVAGDVLLTYDNTEEIRQLADRFGFRTRPVAMKSTHHAEMTELLIGRNLDWLAAKFNDPQASLEFDAQTLPC